MIAADWMLLMRYNMTGVTKLVVGGSALAVVVPVHFAAFPIPALDD